MLQKLILVELKLIWRVQRARFLFILTIFFLLPIIFLPYSLIRDLPYHITGLYLVSTGGICISYGAYLFAWEGSYFNLLMCLDIPLKTFLRSKYWLLVGGCVLQTLLAIFISYFGDLSENSLILIICLLYNIGVNVPVTLFMGKFNLKKIDIDNGNLIFKEQSSNNLLQAFLFFIPALMLLFVSKQILGEESAHLGLALFGGLGFLTTMIMFPSIIEGYKKQRYKIINCFSQ